jgi:hypothetical protein
MALIKLTYFKPSGKYAYDGQMNYSDTLHMFHLSDHIQDLNRTQALPGLGSGVWEGYIHVDAGEHPHGYPLLITVTYPHGDV